MRDSLVQSLIQRQAELSPDRIAVAHQEHCLSYSELDLRANRLGNHMARLGVRPESSVCVCMARSIELIVAILGILKAGGVYVPIDPSYPLERQRSVFRDTRADVLVTECTQAETWSQLAKNTVYPREDWGIIGEESGLPPVAHLGSDAHAYTIHTSGSTGLPKGVAITHGSLANYTVAATENFHLTNQDRVLQFCSISFDTSLEEIFPCLISGATLVLRTEAQMDSVSAFLQNCRRWAVTVADLPTSYWHELLRSVPAEDWRSAESLRLVIIGGEKAATNDIESWQRAISGTISLVNTYGPTETTIVATTCEIDPQAAQAPLSGSSLGSAVPNVQIYLCDESLGLAPDGAAGELYIGGAGLARGYWRRPDLTAERFRPNPFSDVPGQRFYQTGDRAMHTTEHSLKILGRSDRQLKIRGFRVEPEEVEAVLQHHPAIQDAVVLPTEDGQDVVRLVAYLVTKRGYDCSANEMRAYMRTQLPEYLNPAAYVLLERLPLTPTGKLDRSALQALGSQSAGPDSLDWEPGDLVELQLLDSGEDLFEEA
ncbi:MAG TPA: amino acid adenylation domain-containing protein [Blastocatellia bacterium]|nr:amino acid adenylation domain-containing protein [Blastocatellia bacterium]